MIHTQQAVCPHCGENVSLPRQKKPKKQRLVGEMRWRLSWSNSGTLRIGLWGHSGWLGRWEDVLEGVPPNIVPPRGIIGSCALELVGAPRRDGFYCRDPETGHARRAGKADVCARKAEGRRRLARAGWPGAVECDVSDYRDFPPVRGKLWERWPDESAQAYRAFRRYLDDPDRSLPPASASAVQQKRPVAWCWQVRAKAFEADIAKRTEKEIAAIQEELAASFPHAPTGAKKKTPQPPPDYIWKRWAGEPMAAHRAFEGYLFDGPDRRLPRADALSAQREWPTTYAWETRASAFDGHCRAKYAESLDAAIQEQATMVVMSANELLRTLWEQAFFNPGEVISMDEQGNVRFKPLDQIPKRLRRVMFSKIKGRIEKDGSQTTTVEIVGQDARLKALAMLWKWKESQNANRNKDKTREPFLAFLEAVKRGQFNGLAERVSQDIPPATTVQFREVRDAEVPPVSTEGGPRRTVRTPASSSLPQQGNASTFLSPHPVNPPHQLKQQVGKIQVRVVPVHG